MQGGLTKTGISKLQARNILWTLFASKGFFETIEGEGSSLCFSSSWRKACRITSEFRVSYMSK